MRYLAILVVLILVLGGCGNSHKADGDADVDAAPDVSDAMDGTDVGDTADADVPTDGEAECGNGVVEGEEECDEGEDNSDTDPDACREDCVMAYCGDGVRDTGEGCDDGNDVDTDECRNDCSLPTCGDATVDEGEECDDGDDDDTDECLNTCVDASCGDGHVWAGHEDCDDRNDVDGDGCDDCVFSCADAGDCDDANVCTDDACIEGGTGRICDYTDNTASCDDGDACTDPDTCSGGSCVGGAFVCDCTTDDDCVPFEDGNLCNGTYFCDTDRFCKIDSSTIITCDTSADTDCTRNLCEPTTGVCSMTHMSSGTVCDDGDPCNIDDECDGAGTCAGTDVGLTDCSGVCVDLLTDPAHCGGCTSACAVDEICVGGSCVPGPWTDVGGPVRPPPSADPAVAHAIGNDGSLPFVAMVIEYPSFEHDVHVRRFVDPNWVDVGGSLDSVDRNAAPVIDMEFVGTTPYVIFHKGGWTAHVWSYSSSAWSEIGSPGFTTMCMGLQSLDLALDANPYPHLTYFGAGGCGLGVGYAWWDGAAWNFHPSTAWPGTDLITMNGGGWTDIVFTDTAYIALGDMGIHSVKYWDPSGGGAWADRGSTLDMNVAVGWQEPHDMTADSSGDLYVAWAEEDTPGGTDGKVYVKRWVSTDWSLLGTGEISGSGDASNPSITIIGTTPYVAWQEDDGVTDKVHVKRWTGGTWERVGAPLNNDLAHDAVNPDITGIAGVPYIAFREPDTAGISRIWVKSFP